MSRTDVHRPLWVQEHDPENRHRIGPADHRHWERDCWDPQTREWLVERLTPCDVDSEAASGRRCRRWPLYNVCGCRMCTGQDARRQARRRERVRLRADLRAAAKTAAGDRDTIDIVEPRRVTCWVS
jgi:hypothetical protein